MNESSRVALISGGAGGIGRRIAERFSQQGIRVHVCDASAENIEAFLADHPEATATLADVSERDQVARVYAELAERHANLDILVNCAGIAGPTGAVETIDPDAWDRCIAVDLNGVFYVTRLAVPLLRNSAHGCIINMASTAGLFGYPLRSPYAAAKWAMVGLTKTWAMELGRDHIRVNAICPGSVEGPRIDRVIERDAADRGVGVGEIRDSYLRQTSMRTFVTPDDVAEMVLFLASDAASRISGQAICVDGHTEGLTSGID
jgi:NAD(P)-dependent dehydrogenase (short-subunit alcohol dehydrogenase family)